MFGFDLTDLIPQKLAIQIAIVAVIAAVIGGGWLYIKALRSDLKAAEIRVEVVESAMKEQTKTIGQLKADQAMMSAVQGELAKNFNKSETARRMLEKKFEETKSGKQRDFNDLALKKPGLIENAINKGTKDAGRCNEIVTGSPFTKDEASGKTTNSVCPNLLPKAQS